MLAVDVPALVVGIIVGVGVLVAVLVGSLGARTRRRLALRPEGTPVPKPLAKRRQLVLAGWVGAAVVCLVVLAIGLATEHHGHVALWVQWVIFILFVSTMANLVVQAVRRRARRHRPGGN